MNASDSTQIDPETIRVRADEISQGPAAGTPEDDWLRAELELTVTHDYDAVDCELERLGMTLSRLPLEAGVTWRLDLPRGERMEAWKPGNNGLTPPAEIARLVEGVLAGDPLVPMPPLSNDPGAIRLRAMIEVQRHALLAHDPGIRVGDDPENLHERRVAARRTRAFLRAARGYVDPAWRRSLTEPLRVLGEVTGPVRDLDVLIEHVRAEVGTLDEQERAGGDLLIAGLVSEREAARANLPEALAGASYRALLARLRLRPRLAAEAETVPLERIARTEFGRLAAAVKRLGEQPGDTAIHGLRIALKRARYAAELSSPNGKAGERFLADAKALQTLLGEHQDAAVAEQRLRVLGVADSSTAAAFVAGRFAERQRARRERVTERLPKAWKRMRKSGALLH